MMKRLVLVWILCLILTSCTSQAASIPGADTAAPSAYVVEYVVMCPTWPDGKVHIPLINRYQRVSAGITYQNERGGTEQIGSVGIPWSKRFRAKAGTFLYISGQMMGTDSFPSIALDIRVQIKVNGVVVKEATSKGTYAVAIASVTL